MKAYEASELILNPSGSIYHLDLLPEQLAPTIITVGDQNRVAKVSQYFDRIDHKIAKREFVTHTGWIGNKQLTVISTGIGTDNIDIVLNELDALVNIDLENRIPKSEFKQLDFIRIGTTGSLQADIPVDANLVSTYGLGLDGILHFYELENDEKETALLQAVQDQLDNSFPFQPYICGAAMDLVAAICPDFEKGITLTAPGFYAPQGRELRLKSRFSAEKIDRLAAQDFQGLRITNFEMETAGIYGMAKLLGHRAISCNLILANRLNKTFSANPYEAMDQMIRLILERVSETG